MGTSIPLLLGLLMACLVYSGTPWGLGLSPDSVAYVGAAQLFSQPSKLWSLTTQWPPLFPATLAGSVWAFGGMIAAGRSLQAILAVANILLIARVLGRCGIEKPLIWLLLLLLPLQTGFLHIHLMMWSESEFLTLALLDLVFLELAIREPDRARWIVMLALSCGAAIMVRYAGLFLLFVNALGLLAVNGNGRSRFSRMRSALVVTAFSVVPFLAWLGFNRLRGLPGVNRELAWHPPGMEPLSNLTQTLSTWSHLPQTSSLLVIVLLLAAIAVLIRRKRTNNGEQTVMTTLAMLYLLGYSLFIGASISLVDKYTPLDERILFPVLPIVLAVMASVTVGMHNRWHARLLMLPVVLALLLNVADGIDHWRNSRVEGIGFARRSVQKMPVLVWLTRVPKDLSIATNSPEMFTLYLNRGATMLPSKYRSSTGQMNPNYQAQMMDTATNARVVVHFSALGWREYLPMPRELNRLPGFQLVYWDKDALVWYRPGP